MLFFITKIDTNLTYYLLKKTEFIIGRKDDTCDIVLNDGSVSRKHAELKIIQEGESEVVILIDLKSKFKTKVNEKDMTPEKSVRLKNNDIIQFGAFIKFKFHAEHFVTTATKLTPEGKVILHKNLKRLKGQYVDNWSSDCTHLTCDKITLTVKVLLALLDEKPLVLANYWNKYAESVKLSLPPPNIKDYNNPPLMEALVNRPIFNNSMPRKDLFVNKTFLFYTEKEKKTVDVLIEKASGRAISWENDQAKFDNLETSFKDYIIMQTEKTNVSSDFKKIQDYYIDQNKRLIPLSEIALAIINCSSEKDCNPDFNRNKEVFRSPNTNEQSKELILVDKTQTQAVQEIDSTKELKIILPSLDTHEIISERKKNEDLEHTEDNDKEKEVEKNNESQHDVANQTNDHKQSKISQKRKAKEALFNPITHYFKKTATEEIDNIAIPTSKGESSDTRSFPGKILANVIVEPAPKRKADEVETNIPKKQCLENKNILSSPRKGQTKKKSVFSNVSSNNNTQLSSPPYKTNTKDSTLSVSKIINTSGWLTKKKFQQMSNQNLKKIENEIFRKMNELFEKTTITEIIPSNLIRSRQTSNNETVTNNQKTKNFKTFKKVQPLHLRNKTIKEENTLITKYFNETIDLTQTDETQMDVSDCRKENVETQDESINKSLTNSKINKKQSARFFNV